MSHHITPLFLFALVVALPGTASADLLVYEPFDYPDGSLTGQGGALGTAGTWVSTDSVEGSRPIPSSGWWVHQEGDENDVGLSGSNGALDPFGFNSFDGTVADLQTSGGYVGIPGAEDIGDDDPHSGEPARHMDAYIGLDPSVTATFQSETVTWFSFVSVRGWDRNEESPQFIIGTDFTSSGARAFTWNIDGGGQGIGGGGAPPRANYGDILPSYVNLADGVGRTHITPGGYLGEILGGHDGVVDVQGSTGTSDGALESGVQTMLWEEVTPDGEFGAPHIVVGKIEWDADTGGEDIISVVRFLEEDTLSEEAFEDLIDAQPDLSSANWASNKPDLDQSQFDTLNFSGTKFFVDEVRIATTFEEAVPTGVREICDNGTDDDGDTLVDCVDSDCAGNPACPTDLLVRGDVDSSGLIQLTDGVSLLNFLFLGGTPPKCVDAADVDDSGDLNLTDGVAIFNWLFLGGQAPQEPSPSGGDYLSGDCGRDTTADANDIDLGCAAPSEKCGGPP